MLKLYNKSTAMQRFLAFIVDGIILSTFAIGISSLIFLMLGFNIDALQDTRTEFLSDYMMYAYYGGKYEESYKLALSEYAKYAVVFYSILDSFYLVGIILYLFVLPQFWDKQTVGRMLTKTKVIGHVGEVKTGLKRTIIREIVGTWLFYIVIYSFVSGFVIVISALMILISGRGIVDRISSTDLVQDLPLEVDPKTFEQQSRFDREESSQYMPNQGEFRKDDSIDAEVVDLDEKNKNEENDNNESSSSDDGYHIF